MPALKALTEIDPQQVKRLYSFYLYQSNKPALQLSTLPVLALFEGRELTILDICNLLDKEHGQLSNQIIRLKKLGLIRRTGYVAQTAGSRQAQLFSLSEAGIELLQTIRGYLEGSGGVKPSTLAANYAVLKGEYNNLYLPSLITLMMVEQGAKTRVAIAKWHQRLPVNSYPVLQRALSNGLVEPFGCSSARSPTLRLTAKGKELLSIVKVI